MNVKVDINVTDQHIQNGEAQSCESCPVALAIDASLKDGFHSHVMGEDVRISTEDGRLVARRRLPPVARLFIRQFDSADPDKAPTVSAFGFTLSAFGFTLSAFGFTLILPPECIR